MSRSNPTDRLANPATRWFDWNGERGAVSYYDKATKTTVPVALPFTFVLLDELGSVRGWHEASKSGIYSNEVRDTRADVLVVKAFKGGTLAEGLYKAIKDRANTAGGHFTTTCYIAYKHGATADGLALGAIRFKGSALGAWMEFRKANRGAIYTDAVEIAGYTEGKKGRVVFRTPTFVLRPLSDASQRLSFELDRTLQAYLDVYLSRTKRDQVETEAAHDDAPEPTDDDAPADIAPDEDDIPF